MTIEQYEHHYCGEREQSGYFHGHLSVVDCFHEFLSSVIFRGLRRRHATHQTVITAWRTTAGHNATPCSPNPMLAKAMRNFVAFVF